VYFRGNVDFMSVIKYRHEMYSAMLNAVRRDTAKEIYGFVYATP